MKDVVIWGCPRSGTSITLELFASIFAYRTYFEPGMWIFSDGSGYMPCAIKNPVSHDPTGGLSADLGEVVDRFPNARHVFVVRNPLDAVCSLMPGMNEQPHPPALPEELQARPVLDRSAWLWRIWNGAGYETLMHLEPLVVRYEDLVSSAATEGARILEWAGAPDARISDWVLRVNDAPGTHEARFQDRWHRAHEQHVGRWRTELSELDVVTIHNIVGTIPERFGYRPPHFTIDQETN